MLDAMGDTSGRSPLSQLMEAASRFAMLWFEDGLRAPAGVVVGADMRACRRKAASMGWTWWMVVDKEMWDEAKLGTVVSGARRCALMGFPVVLA